MPSPPCVAFLQLLTLSPLSESNLRREYLMHTAVQKALVCFAAPLPPPPSPTTGRAGLCVWITAVVVLRVDCVSCCRTG